jgi:hypothetical protein
MAPPPRTTLHHRGDNSSRADLPKDSPAAIRPLTVRNNNGYEKIRPTSADVLRSTMMTTTADIGPTKSNSAPKSPSSMELAVSSDLPFVRSRVDYNGPVDTDDVMSADDIFQDDDDTQSASENLDRQQKSRSMTPPPQPSMFRPPSEVMLLPDFVPPSPMADPNFEIVNLSHRRISVPDSLLHDDMDHVRLKNQLWDAHRLVRVILGRQPSSGDLDNGAILQAIRAYAGMRQELLELQQKVRQQEEKFDDSDPPSTFMQAIESPTSTAGGRKSVRSFSSDAAAASASPRSRSSMGLRSAPSSQSRPFDRTRLVEAAKKIQNLEKELHDANTKVKKLEQQRGPRSEEAGSIGDEVQSVHVSYQKRLSQLKLENDQLQCQLEKSQNKLVQSQLKTEQLSEMYNQSIEHCKTHVEEVSVRLHAIPKSRVEPKRAEEIRTKLQVLIRTLAQHSAQAEIESLHCQLAQQERNADTEIQSVRRQLTEQQLLMTQYELQLQGSSQSMDHHTGLKVAKGISDTTSSRSGNVPSETEVEDILLTLSSVPAASVSIEERKRIREHVRTMVQNLAVPQLKQQDELEALKSTSKARIEELQRDLQTSHETSRADRFASKGREAAMNQRIQDLELQLQSMRASSSKNSSTSSSEQGNAIGLQSGASRSTDMLRASQARADRLQAERDLAVGEMSSLSLQIEESRLRIDELVGRIGQAGLDCGSHSLGLESRQQKIDLDLDDKNCELTSQSGETDTDDSPSASRRLQMLHEEREAVLSTIRVLEELQADEA